MNLFVRIMYAYNVHYIPVVRKPLPATYRHYLVRKKIIVQLLLPATAIIILGLNAIVIHIPASAVPLYIPSIRACVCAYALLYQLFTWLRFHVSRSVLPSTRPKNSLRCSHLSSVELTEHWTLPFAVVVAAGCLFCDAAVGIQTKRSSISISNSGIFSFSLGCPHVRILCVIHFFSCFEKMILSCFSIFASSLASFLFCFFKRQQFNNEQRFVIISTTAASSWLSTKRRCGHLKEMREQGKNN